MVLCRFVSSDCSLIGDREFDTVGQRAELSEQGFREAVLGHAMFITEENFKKVEFTEDELLAHGSSGMRIDPPQSFMEKLSLAQQFYHDAYAAMTRGGVGALVEA